jgi:3-oxoacyl-[acyl-carrier protein] reductase
MIEINLKGKVALVTGASRGLGRATALLLAQAGADVAVHFARNRKAADAVAGQCRRFGVQAMAVQADMAGVSRHPSAQISRMFAQVRKQMKRLDILVGNAGIWKEAAIDRMTDRELAEMLNVNVKGVFACCREAARIMKRQKSGRIILVSSTAGQRGEAFHSHYAASKGAVISLTKSLAPELAPHGILVNCVAPGWFDTDMSRPSLKDPRTRKQVLATIPLHRVGRPEELAGTILFLASELSTFVTGEILNVNGGAVLVG